MDNNRTVLEHTYYNWHNKMLILYDDLNKTIQKFIDDGMDELEAVDKAFKQVNYNDRTKEFYGSALGSSSTAATVGTIVNVDFKLAKDYFLFTEFEGSTLSSRITSSKVSKIVKDELKTFFVNKGTVKDLFNKLKDAGYEAYAKVPKAVQKAVSLFEKTGSLTTEVREALNAARLYTSSLSGIEDSSRQLQKAYDNILDSIEKNNLDMVKKTVEVAVNKKVDYYNKRIGRTEFSRAYEMSFQRAVYEDTSITGVQVILSSRHTNPDKCDVYAECDAYGLGEGVAPKDAGYNLPFHSQCMCTKVAVKIPIDPKKNKFSKSRVNKYLSNIDEDKRSKIVGKEYNKPGLYVDGLEKKGFAVDKKANMIPKSILIYEDNN
jgi:hypothetical protein